MGPRGPPDPPTTASSAGLSCLVAQGLRAAARCLPAAGPGHRPLASTPCTELGPSERDGNLPTERPVLLP